MATSPASAPTPVQPAPAPAQPKPAPQPFPTTAADWAGASPQESSPSQQGNASPAANAAAEVKRVDVGPLSFAVPQGWVPRPPSSSMRLAEMLVPANPQAGNLYTPHTDALVAFFRLGGSVEDNVGRWAASMTDAQGKPVTPTIVVKEIAGLKVHDVQMNGTYLDGMPGGERTSREAWGFRAAIIETGLPLTFIRMTGPQSLMEAHADEWTQMLESMNARKMMPEGHP
jgi:hypothetical protein